LCELLQRNVRRKEMGTKKLPSLPGNIEGTRVQAKEPVTPVVPPYLSFMWT
jgi:hypothetical protein